MNVRANLFLPRLGSGAAAVPLRWRVYQKMSAMVGLGSCFVVLRILSSPSRAFLRWVSNPFLRRINMKMYTI